MIDTYTFIMILAMIHIDDNQINEVITDSEETSITNGL